MLHLILPQYKPALLLGSEKNREKLKKKFAILMVFGKMWLGLMIGAILTVIIDHLIVQRVIANAIEYLLLCEE